MAKLMYLHDGEFTIAGQAYRPRIEHLISDVLAAEIHAALPHWEARGFRLIGYVPPAPVAPDGESSESIDQ